MLGSFQWVVIKNKITTHNLIRLLEAENVSTRMLKFITEQQERKKSTVVEKGNLAIMESVCYNYYN